MATGSRIQKPHSAHSRRRIRPGWALVLVGAGLIYFFGVSPAWTLIANVPRLEGLDHVVQGDITHHRYSELLSELPETTRLLSQSHQAMHRLAYLSWLPVVGSPFRDMMHLADAGYSLSLAANQVAPRLRPVLLQKKKGGRSSGLDRVLSHLPQLWMGLARALPDLKAADRSLSLVDFEQLPRRLGAMASVARYQPELLMGTKILAAMQAHRTQVSQMLGIQRPQRYLLILENSGELRAGGGFITAYGYLNVNHGVLRRAHIQAISLLQKKIRYHPPTPWPINNFWPKLTYWGIRDAAIWPNVPSDARAIERFYDSVPHHLPINGVVFADSWLADSLIQKTGSLHLGGAYGNQQITAEHANLDLEYLAERVGSRQAKQKLFLGALFNELRARLLHASGSSLMGLLTTLEAGVTQGHLAFYFNAPPEQRLAVRWGASGQVPQHVQGDYLCVVNDNLGAHKDNFFLQTTISTSLVRQTDGLERQTTQIRWTMPAVAHGWLVVPYIGWIDVYVPKGAHLISAEVMPGSKIRIGVNQGINKTVYGMRLYLPARTSLSAPPTTASETLVYTLPRGINPHRLLIQKQPGVFGQTITVKDGPMRHSYYQTQSLHLRLP